jgi:hypothetical protein
MRAKFSPACPVAHRETRQAPASKRSLHNPASRADPSRGFPAFAFPLLLSGGIRPCRAHFEQREPSLSRPASLDPVELHARPSERLAVARVSPHQRKAVPTMPTTISKLIRSHFAPDRSFSISIVLFHTSAVIMQLGFNAMFGSFLRLRRISASNCRRTPVLFLLHGKLNTLGRLSCGEILYRCTFRMKF